MTESLEDQIRNASIHLGEIAVDVGELLVNAGRSHAGLHDEREKRKEERRVLTERIKQYKAERDELQEKLSENLAGEKLVLGLKTMGLSGEVQEWLGVFQLLAATGISKDALRKVARGYSAGNLKLADAPPQEPGPVTAEDPPKRLAVADLDAAEVGSVLSAKGDLRERVKKSSGLWAVIGEVALALPSRSLTTEGRTLTPPTPARRGRVVEASELRKGDAMDVWKNDVLMQKDVEVAGGNQWWEEEGWEFRLVSRKPPVPSEHRVVMVYREECEEPYDSAQPMIWTGDWYENDKWELKPGDIADWSPARVIPAGQEGNHD